MTLIPIKSPSASRVPKREYVWIVGYAQNLISVSGAESLESFALGPRRFTGTLTISSRAICQQIVVNGHIFGGIAYALTKGVTKDKSN